MGTKNNTKKKWGSENIIPDDDYTSFYPREDEESVLDHKDEKPKNVFSSYFNNLNKELENATTQKEQSLERLNRKKSLSLIGQGLRIFGDGVGARVGADVTKRSNEGWNALQREGDGIESNYLKRSNNLRDLVIKGKLEEALHNEQLEAEQAKIIRMAKAASAKRKQEEADLKAKLKRESIATNIQRTNKLTDDGTAHDRAVALAKLKHTNALSEIKARKTPDEDGENYTAVISDFGSVNIANEGMANLINEGVKHLGGISINDADLKAMGYSPSQMEEAKKSIVISTLGKALQAKGVNDEEIRTWLESGDVTKIQEVLTSIEASDDSKRSINWAKIAKSLKSVGQTKFGKLEKQTVTPSTLKEEVTEEDEEEFELPDFIL